jgi:signal transduction histidine kinase/GAF domain-containing protein
MTVVHETIKLLLAPPGGLVYHLLILFSLEATLGLAVGAWRRRRVGGPEEISDTFVVTAAGMLLARLVLIVVALFGLSETRYTATVMPPLERAVDTAVILLLAWALLPWGRHQNLSWFFPGFGLLSTALVFAFLLPGWQTDLAANPSLFYNGTLQEGVWILVRLALLGSIVLGLLWRRGREWALWLSVPLLLAVGQVLQLLTPDRVVHIAGWERLVQLIAFPLLAVTVYRCVMGELSLRTHELEEASQDSLSQIAGLIYLLESGQRTGASLDMDEVLSRAVREVVRILKVDICGLFFPVDVAQDKASLAAVYSPQSRGAAQAVEFSLAEHPALDHAVKRRKQIVITASADQSQVRELYGLMGSNGAGPVLIQPLLYNGTAIGALLLGNPTSQQQFTSNQQKLCQALSRQVAVAIENARRYQASQTELEAWKAQLQEGREGYQRIEAVLRAQLEQSQEDAAHFARRLDEMTARSKRERQNAESLAQQFQKAEEERAQLEAQVGRFRQEVQTLQRRWQEQAAEALRVRAALETQLAQAGNQLSQMVLRMRQQRSHASLADAVLETLAIGLVIADEKGQIDLVNAAAEQFLAQPIEQMLGNPIGEICGDVRWREGVDRLFDQVAVSKAEPDVAFIVDKGGDVLMVRLRALYDEAGKFVAVVALLGEPAEAEEGRQARDEFLGALAQELRTPMTSITGYTDLLLGESVGIVSDMQRKFLQRIKANIERMGSMLNDLIGVTAIDSGQLHLEPEVVDIAEAAQAAIASAQAQLEEKNLSLSLDLPSDIGSIEVDPSAFQQIMSNLISNACQASPAGGEVSIKASCETEDEASGAKRLVVAVTDSGGGIAPEDQPRVFERFYRAEQALIAGLGETGVGLSIVKALVEAHRGQVWAEGEMGQGSTFVFALPFTADQRDGSSKGGSSPSSRGRQGV